MELLSERFNTYNLQLEEVAESFSENELSSFHLDAIPAVLGELVEVCAVRIFKKGKEPEIVTEEIEQDGEVIDDIFAFIQTMFSGSSTDDDNYVFSMDDIKALLKRFLNEQKEKIVIKDVLTEEGKKKRQLKEDQVKAKKNGEQYDNDEFEKTVSVKEEKKEEEPVKQSLEIPRQITPDVPPPEENKT